MVEELKLAIKVDDDAIEQSLLKQFANAEKMANKVVLTFNNIDLDDKAIEAKFKEMQKMAGKNPIDLSIDKSSIEMLSAISKQLGNIFDIAKGKSIIDSSATVSEINKITQAAKELNKAQTGSENIQSKSFTTKNKTEAYNQLKQMADVFKNFYGNEEAMHTKAGTEAAYAYYKAYEEALKKSVAQSKLQKVTVDADTDSFYNANKLSSDRIKDFESFKKYGGDITDLSAEILSLEGKLLDFADAYTKVKANLGDAPITPDIIRNIEDYVELLDKARYLESFGDDNDKDIISDHRNSAQFWLDDALFKAKIQNEEYISSLKEVKEEKENLDASLNKSQTSDVDSSVVEQQNKIQEELKETENTITKVYRAYNKMSGMVGEAGISWFSDDLDTMKTYMDHYKDRELVSGDIDINKLLSIDAQGSKHNAITYLGDYSDEASIKITDLYNKIQQLKSELSKAPNDALAQQLKELELEYDKLSEDTSNLYGTHTTNWFAIQAKEAGYLGIAIKNVVDDYDGLIDKPTTTIALFDTNLLENQEKITSKIRENIENIKGLNFDVSKAVETDANSFINNISPEDLNDEIREIQEFNSLMKLTKMTSEELGSSLREVFSYAHENPDVLDNLYDYNPNLVDVFDKNTNIGKYFDELVSSTNWDVDESSLESIYLDFAKKLQDYENKYIESVKQKLNIISNNIQSDNTYTEETISSNNSIQNELKETQEQAEQTAKAVQNVSKTQIEDVFQGDKIDQATTSAKELDKILEQVDIPTDSFDDVLSKLDLTESKLKEIVKITKQSVSDSEGKFHDSYTLKDKRGSTEIYGLSSNTEKGQLLRSNIVEYDAKEIEKANKQILKSEQELQSQKDAFHKKNLTAIDLEIQKREEESKKVSSALKTQMEERQKQLSSMESSLKSYQDKAFNLSIKPDDAHRFPEYQAQLDSINKAIQDYETHINSLQNKGVIDPSDIDEANRLKSIIEESLKNTKKFSSGDKGFTNIGADKVLEKINSILEQNSRMSKTAKDQIKAYYNEIYSGNPTRPLNEILDSVYKIVQQEREAGRAGKSWLEVFKDKKIYSFIGQAASMFSFYDLVNVGREGFETIKEYDKALTEMNKVSNESIEILKEFQQESFEVADSIGATASAIQNSTADWMKLGYSLKDSAELSEWANIYANVGDMEIDEATEHMVSSVKAWSSEFANDIEASEAIVDRYNHIGNSYAITSADIGEAMETSAAALKAGGNSLNESLGLIVSGNLIQQDASTTASALKILSLRVRGAKADLEEMGETTEGLADSSSKMREEIQALTGVDIMLDEDTFKSTAQIIKEIGAVWDSMSDVSQAATLEKIAGIIFCLKFVETHIYRTHLTALIA